VNTSTADFDCPATGAVVLRAEARWKGYVGPGSDAAPSSVLRAAGWRVSSLYDLRSGSIRGILTKKGVRSRWRNPGAFDTLDAKRGQGARGLRRFLAQYGNKSAAKTGKAGRAACFGEAEPARRPALPNLGNPWNGSRKLDREFRAIGYFSGIPLDHVLEGSTGTGHAGLRDRGTGGDGKRLELIGSCACATRSRPAMAASLRSSPCRTRTVRSS